MKWRLCFVKVTSFLTVGDLGIMIHIHDTITTQRTQMQLEYFFKTCFFLNLKLRVSICERMWADRRLSRMEASEAPATLRVRNTEVLHDQDPASPPWVCPECRTLNPWWQRITLSLNMKLKASSITKHLNLCEGSTMISVCRDGWGWGPLRLLQRMKAWFSTTTALASA